MLVSNHNQLLIALLASLVFSCGCIAKPKPSMFSNHPHNAASSTLSIAQNDQEQIASEYRIEPKPRTAAALTDEFINLTLDEAIEIALQDTKILRSLGATSVVNPQGLGSRLDPAIAATDPNFGVEAALSQFDTRVASSITYAKNDDVFNNPLLGGDAQEVREDLGTGAFSLFKTNGIGTQFGLTGDVSHSQSDSPGLVFSHLWQTTMAASVRHPLLQGSGVEFNQIAGPNGQLGLRNSFGVTVSRINKGISEAQFERQVGEMVAEIIDAYWQLHLAYQNFEAIKTIRDMSLTTWKIARTRNESNLPGGEADRESQAQEQFYQFQGLLLSALNGSRLTGQLGVFQAEADLRRLLNVPPSDLMIRPSDVPVIAGTVYDWNELVKVALASRVELRAQKLRLNQRELELRAARNFLLPRLDTVATYRNNGFGDDLAGGRGRFSSALSDAISNDHGEWELGFQYDMTIGARQASSGVRNAELMLCREKALMKDQENQILHDLGSAVRQVDLSSGEIEIGKKRVSAAERTVEARIVGFDADLVGFDELLEAQRRLLDSKLGYFQVVTNNEIARTRLLVETGQLLTENGVSLSK